jgi:uncharacterized integral membrane protein (TIGR00697 family)
LGAFFITNALVAQMIGVKIFSLEASLGFDPFDWEILGVSGLGFNLTAGVLLWPVVFIMTDIINEYYGQKGVRYLSFLAAGLISYAMVMIFLSINLTPNEWWAYESNANTENPGLGIRDMNLAFKKIFGQGLWIIVGSLVAFLVSQLLDVLVFHQIRKWTGEKHLWARATGSTLVSQFIDSYIVLLIAFYIGNDWELVRVLAIGTVNYTYKFGMAIVLTPALYIVHFAIDKFLGKELANTLKEQAALPQIR